jgi:hypothetical protein
LTTPEPVPGSPLKFWQWAELWSLVAVISVQIWLYRVSVIAAAAWGLVVPALVIHTYFWMAPLVREHRHEEPDDHR